MAMQSFFIRCIRWYQASLSSYTPHCRYIPSCSQYAIDAIRMHGAFKGILLSVLRLLRCNRRYRQGIDFVPKKFPVIISAKKTFLPLGGSWKVDIVILLSVSVLYLANKLTAGLISCWFMRCYFNDVCCGIWFMAFTNLLLWFRKIRIKRLTYILLYIGLWGIYWEIIGPYVKEIAVTDIWDLVAYLMGSLIYGIIISVKEY